MDILKIVIKEEWLKQIASGQKTTEYREVKPFWTSRLYTKEGKPRKYDRVLFIAGYNPDVPRLEAEYGGVRKVKDLYHIAIGTVLKKQNFKKAAKK